MLKKITKWETEDGKVFDTQEEAEDFMFEQESQIAAQQVVQFEVPVELLERIQESLGSFVSDQGWSQSDMDTADALDGLLAAAPRPSVPQGWKLVPEWPTVEMSVAGDDVYREDGPDVFSSNTIYTRMLAAAPQPPEAAPVQLPEPVAFVHTPALVWNGKIRPVVSFAKYEDDYKSGIYSLRTPLYTEQQVRELLASHGIKVTP